MIAKERRNIRQGKPKTFSFRQKIIQVIWDFKKGNHLEQLHQLHPKLLETFPEIIKLDKLAQNFRNLFTEKRSEKLVEWLTEHEQMDYPFIQSFIRGIEQDISAVTLSIQEP